MLLFHVNSPEKPEDTGFQEVLVHEHAFPKGSCKFVFCESFRIDKYDCQNERVSFRDSG